MSTIKETVEQVVGIFYDKDLAARKKRFHEASKRLESPDGTFTDAVSVYANVTHDAFYGSEKNIARRKQWAQSVKGFLAYKASVELLPASMDVATLSLDRQGGFFGLLFETFKEEDVTWANRLLGGVVSVHRSQDEVEDFEKFYSALQLHNISDDVLSLLMPEVAQMRKPEPTIQLPEVGQIYARIVQARIEKGTLVVAQSSEVEV